MNMLHVNIDGYEITVPEGTTVLEAAKKLDIHIPTLCHDERVKEYGACGVCTVEAEGMPKLLRACATKVMDGMAIHTKTQRVIASRKVALELLLTDHEGDCRAPCKLACPAGTDCQGYVGLIANGEYAEALKLIKDVLPLPASIGRVCPHPCETACRRQLVDEPISIARLKAFVSDIDLEKADSYLPEMAQDSGKHVAVVGGGPAGLTTAYFLRVQGHSVTVYDKMPQMGGMLRYGIPQYRLPKEVVDKEVSVIEKMGAVYKNNQELGKDINLEDLRRDYDAVMVCTGAWVSSSMRLEGEDLEGIFGGIDFLRDVALHNEVNIGEKVAIVGGGNTAMDACRTAVRLGAKEVSVIYRRTREEMPAEDFEIEEAMEEGVNFLFLTNPVAFYSEGNKLTGVKLEKMQLGEPDASGRRRPMPTGEYIDLSLDSFILAIGQGTDVKGLESLEMTKWHTVIADENTFQTSISGVFACGDLTNDGADIAIAAIGEAEKAAQVIDSYLNGKMIGYKKPYYVTREITQQDLKDKKIKHRLELEALAPEMRKTNFEEVLEGYTPERAQEEAMRCLECGCKDYFECKLVDYANEYDVAPQRVAGVSHHRYQENTHPFIEQNVDKCILCGLCVRVCDEVMGRTALGLVDRGFATVVSPPFGESLEKTDCVSCGQCVTLCPTGALIEKTQMKKYVPVAEQFTASTCSFCSVGCAMDVANIGDSVTRVLPAGEDGLLCVGGRFGSMLQYDKETRLTKPMVRQGDALKETDFETAYEAIRQGFAAYAPEDMAVVISERYTLEEAYLIKQYANQILGTTNVYSGTVKPNGLEEVFGLNASTNTMDELQSTQQIVLVATDVVDKALIAGMKIKKAVENGASLTVISPMDTSADEWANKKYSADSTAFLMEALAYLENGTCDNEAAVEFAENYKNAKSAMVVYDANSVSVQAQKLIAKLAFASGHIGRAHNGIIQLQSGANTQGLILLGVKPFDASKNYKAIFSFGENMPSHFEKAEFLAVQELVETQTTQMANVFLPGNAFAETNGTYIAADRKFGCVQQVITPMANKDTITILRELAQSSPAVDFYTPHEVLVDISRNVEGFAGAAKCMSCAQHSRYWPMNESPILKPIAKDDIGATENDLVTPTPPTNAFKFILHTKV